jgi:hypothetical protein
MAIASDSPELHSNMFMLAVLALSGIITAGIYWRQPEENA